MEVYYKDTCLGCYLQNHYNGDHELLIGIIPAGQNVDQAVDDLRSEISESDKVPESVKTWIEWKALKEACKDVDFRWIDDDGNRCEEQPETDEHGDSSYVWFVLRW